ncbi:FGGY-family carbohydrate kinase [uncultured Tateyamaria sp.]|uniref:FGGY-family carbohydrate kinase n=1 Tax=Tateyamaria sp. 1078 TaxID=3417464 RepID=UPI00261C18FF|nr:FGGY-family carbohydrate kinase [uncultured Tateyamaria sp.]
MTLRHIAVIDIGKTNAKLALVNASDLSEIAVVTRPNTVKPGPPWPHFDVEGHWAFVLENLLAFHAAHGVHAISVTTHGACAALLDRDGTLAAPILDYEHAGPDDVALAYEAVRPPFAETGSPKLAGGLNIGAQLFWQFGTDPTLRSRTHRIVTYPQYWGFRLTGVAAMDVTSLGCHTDLWDPRAGVFSSLVAALGITDKMAPVVRPSDVLGPLLPQVADQTGLPPETPVFCGIHDSNASLLPYVLREQGPFSVVSTGTWVVAMSIDGAPVALDPARDTLINVTALGDPAPSARFMGGREHDVAMGGDYPDPTDGDVDVILAQGIMLMPAIVPDTGPFKGCAARWIGTEPPQRSALRGAAVALYLALVTAECLSNIGHRGPVIVEGPFAKNSTYLRMLSVATGSDVHLSTGTTGTSAGAALLAVGASGATSALHTALPVDQDMSKRLKDYSAAWRAACVI